MRTPYTETSADTLTGAINGTNTDFTLSRTPDSWSVIGFVNWVFQVSSVSGDVVTFSTAPQTGDTVAIFYTTGATALSASAVDIANIALTLIGVEQISAIDNNTPRGKVINGFWSHALSKLLQDRDWLFAKSRAALTDSGTTPLYNFDYAYALPSDFLRLVRPTGPRSFGINPAAPTVGSTYYFYAPLVSQGQILYDNRVYPPGFPYKIEALPDGTFCLFTNYDNTDNDIYINYIKYETDVSLYSPNFNMCLAHYLASLAALPLTHDLALKREMENAYLLHLAQADIHNSSLDEVDNETGSNEWEEAGRS